jgi:hypothetical protein
MAPSCAIPAFGRSCPVEDSADAGGAATVTSATTPSRPTATPARETHRSTTRARAIERGRSSAKMAGSGCGATAADRRSARSKAAATCDATRRWASRATLARSPGRTRARSIERRCSRATAPRFPPLPPAAGLRAVGSSETPAKSTATTRSPSRATRAISRSGSPVRSTASPSSSAAATSTRKSATAGAPTASSTETSSFAIDRPPPVPPAERAARAIIWDPRSSESRWSSRDSSPCGRSSGRRSRLR